MTAPALLVFALALAPAQAPDRVETILDAAHASASVARGWRWSTADLEALIDATTYEEGDHWSEAVHAGTRTGDHGLARCLGQVHVGLLVPAAEWRTLAGVDASATRRCTDAVARVLVACSTCAPRGPISEASVARIVAAYATGRTCRASSSWWRRARLWRRFREALA